MKKKINTKEKSALIIQKFMKGYLSNQVFVTLPIITEKIENHTELKKMTIERRYGAGLMISKFAFKDKRIKEAK